MNIDVLAVGAHPDDVELGVGGTLMKFTEKGFKVAILDLTRGELSSRGTIEERLEEASEAARLLNITVRRNAELPDGGVDNTTEQQEGLIPLIRSMRPQIILSHAQNDRHPDHRKAYDLVRDANFFAGVSSIETGDAPYRAPHIYYYHPYFEDKILPDLVVDISQYFEQKVEALRAHRSQFHNSEYGAPSTFVSTEGFWEAIRKRAEYWGSRIDVEFGEPLYAEGPVGVSLPPGLKGTE